MTIIQSTNHHLKPLLSDSKSVRGSTIDQTNWSSQSWLASIEWAGCNTFSLICNTFSIGCNIFYHSAIHWQLDATHLRKLPARKLLHTNSSAHALRWINYWNITVVINRSNVLILRYHNIKNFHTLRFEFSIRFAIISHDWKLSRDIKSLYLNMTHIRIVRLIFKKLENLNLGF